MMDRCATPSLEEQVPAAELLPPPPPTSMRRLIDLSGVSDEDSRPFLPSHFPASEDIGDGVSQKKSARPIKIRRRIKALKPRPRRGRFNEDRSEGSNAMGAANLMTLAPPLWSPSSAEEMLYYLYSRSVAISKLTPSRENEGAI